MKYQTLGQSGLVISRLCLGTMIFGERNARGADEKTSVAMIDAYIEAGGNFIDTADVYVGGESEKIVGRALKNHQRNQIVLATKVRMPMGNGPNDLGLSRKHIVEGCEASLKRLDVETIDLYYVHLWDPLTPLEETLRALDDLVAAGKVHYIGVSNFKAWQLMKALSLSDCMGYSRFIAAQYQHSLVARDIEREFSELFIEENVGEVVWGPLGGGFLSGKYKKGDKPKEGRISITPNHAEEAWQRRSIEHNWKILDVVGEIAEARGAGYSQIALAWLLTKPEVASIIVGARTMVQLQDNLGAADMELSDEEMTRLDTVSQIEPGYPYRMIEAYGARDLT